MHSPRKRTTATLLALTLLGVPARAQDIDSAIRNVLGGDPATYRQVIEDFQAAVKAGDAAAAAALVSYPLSVVIDGRKRQISGKGDFVANFAGIVTPAIAAAIASEKIDDMMVNDQGVMLGNGEVWVSGVCLDHACAKSRIRVITIQSGLDVVEALPVPAATAGVAPGVLRTFGDWVVGCDNLRACTALGLNADDGPNGYVAIRRGGGADDAPRITLNVLASDSPASPSLQLSFGASKLPFPETVLPVEAQGGFLMATVGPEMTPALINSLTGSTRLDLTELDGGKAADAQRVSLRGSAAALLYMDDQQKRVGTETALLNPGTAGAETIPPVPVLAAPSLVAMKAMPDPMPPLPAGVAGPSDESCAGGFEPMAFTLSATQTLWAVCAQAGAYNIDYTMWLVGPDGARKVAFGVPGVVNDDPTILTNPNLNPDNLSLNTIALGEGLADCGMTADWGWTGSAFTLLRYSEMDICRGVDQSDWPTLYLAERL